MSDKMISQDLGMDFRVSQVLGGATVEFPDQPLLPDFSSATAYVGPARAAHPPLAM